MIPLIGQSHPALDDRFQVTPPTRLTELLNAGGPLVFHLPLTEPTAVAFRQAGQTRKRVFSQVSILSFDERVLLVTDGLVHEEPDLQVLTGIISNSLHVARKAGIPSPKVAVLSGVEVVSPQMGSAVPAAVMEAMGRRGQFGPDVWVEGPLSMDVALSPEAAAEKHVQTPVAGRANVLVGHRVTVARGVAFTLRRFAEPNRFLSVLTDGKDLWPLLLPFMADVDVQDTLAFCGME